MDSELKIPENNLIYSEKSYWNDRFEKEEKYEWLVNYSQLKDILKQILIDNKQKNKQFNDQENKQVDDQENKQVDDDQDYKQLKCLIIGCGNSQLGNEMTLDGFTNITNIDISNIVISKMQKKYPKQKYIEMDIMDLKLADNSIDLIIDKATIDTLQIDVKDPWNVQQEVQQRVDKCLQECSRVLAIHGQMVMVSFQQPHFRLPILKKYKYQWHVQKHLLLDIGLGYFVYTVDKLSGQQWQQECQLIQQQLQKQKEEQEANIQEQQQQQLYESSSEYEDEEGLSRMFIDREYKLCNWNNNQLYIQYYALQTCSTDYDLTGQVLWEGGGVLVEYMCTIDREWWTDKTVLEVGSGPGLGGLAALLLGANQVVLTDYQQPVLHMLQQTIQQLYTQYKGQVFTCQLDWHKVNRVQQLQLLDQKGQTAGCFVDRKYQVVIGSDVVFWPQSIQPLVQVLNLLFSLGAMQFIMVYTERSRDTHRLLKNTLYNHQFSIQEVGQQVSKPRSQQSYIYLITK